MYILIYMCLCVIAGEGCGNGLFKSRQQGAPTSVTLAPLPPLKRTTPPSDKRSDTSQDIKDGDVVVPLLLLMDKIVARVAVGTLIEGDEGPEQEFAMHMDLSEDQVILPSVNCEYTDCTKLPYRTYLASRSSTIFRQEWRTVDLSRATFNIRGITSQETFKIGDGQKAVVLKQQEFVEVTDVRYGFSGFDGVFGLSLVSSGGILPQPVWNVPKDKSVKPVFGIYINKIPNGNEIGSIVFGGKDEALMDGALNSHDVIKVRDNEYYGGWNIKFDKIEVIHRDGTRTTVQSTLSGISSITSPVSEATPSPDMELIGLPTLLLTATMRAILGSSKSWLPTGDFDCGETWKNMPNLAFILGGHEYVMTPEEYFRPENGKCKHPFKNHHSKIVLGRLFMSIFYTRFDIGKKQVQFAKSSGIY